MIRIVLRSLIVLTLGSVAFSNVPITSADSFGRESEIWAESFCVDDETCLVGDFDGDGRDDVVAFVRSTETDDRIGDVYVALSDGETFAQPRDRWADFFCIDDELCKVGDFNDDGRDDIIAFVRSTQDDGQEGDVYVALSNGEEFGPSGGQWEEFFCVDDELCEVGDFNGDGRDDIITFVHSTQDDDEEGDVYVALSNGSDFESTDDEWEDFFCIDDETCGVGDFNGDGRDDIITFVGDSEDADDRGDVYVALSDGDSFEDSAIWQEFFCVEEQICEVGDFDGDGRDDIIAFVRGEPGDTDRGEVYVALSEGDTFGPSRVWQTFFCVDEEVCGVGDFNGDDRADIATFVRSTEAGGERGAVYVSLSTEDDLPPGDIFDEQRFIPIVIR